MSLIAPRLNKSAFVFQLLASPASMCNIHAVCVWFFPASLFFLPACTCYHAALPLCCACLLFLSISVQA